jgi:hypothetical protein
MTPPWEWPWPSWLFTETTTWPVAVVLGSIALVLVTWGASLWHDAWRRCGRQFWRDFAHWLGAAMLGESLLYWVLFVSIVRDGQRVALWLDALFVMIGIPFMVAFALWARVNRRDRPP